MAEISRLSRKATDKSTRHRLVIVKDGENGVEVDA